MEWGEHVAEKKETNRFNNGVGKASVGHDGSFSMKGWE
jgi:hypothetical protein